MGLEKYKQTLSSMDKESLEVELTSLNRIKGVADDVIPKIRIILELLRK